MPFSRILPLSILLASLHGVSSTLPPNFPVTGASPDLTLTFLNNTVSPSGELIPRNDTALTPIITTPVWVSTSAAILISLDTDAHPNGIPTEVLHLLTSNVTLAPDNRTLILPSTEEAPWTQPRPPAGDAAHRYTFLLFAQPDGFSVPEAFEGVMTTRAFFNVSTFVEMAGLGEPVAGNWFRVENGSAVGTGTGTVGVPSQTSTYGVGASATGLEFEGGAARGGVKGVWGLGVGMAMVAGIMAF